MRAPAIRFPPRLAGWALLTLYLLLLVQPAHALTAQQLMTEKSAPKGVVFEIIEGKPADLEWALGQIREDIEALRLRFPGIAVAVVSHGREQFALTTENKTRFGGIHELGRSLVADDVPVHVCATHAGWYDVAPEDFPDFVSVSSTGPAEVHRYEALGYRLIVVERR